MRQKNQYNSFGKYKYRSCEDILEGVKPLLNGLFLSISDEVVLIGDRYYVKARQLLPMAKTVIRQPLLHERKKAKKGMDSAQVTGATSSYARKYCLNGLFGIDDAKDADTDEHKHQQNAAAKQSKPSPTPEQVLKAFTDAALQKNTVEELKQAFAKAWKDARRHTGAAQSAGRLQHQTRRIRRSGCNGTFDYCKTKQTRKRVSGRGKYRIQHPCWRSVLRSPDKKKEWTNYSAVVFAKPGSASGLLP